MNGPEPQPPDTRGDREPVSFLGRPLPDWLTVRLVSIPAHSEMPYEPFRWSGALVVVEAGEIELECARGTSARFGAGAVLFFDGLGLRAVRNDTAEPALLAVAARRTATRRYPPRGQAAGH
jgi:hypothetical protein